MLNYPRDQVTKLYESLPQDLKDALYSQESADNIGKICEENNITDSDDIFEITKYTGYVLLGLVPPDDLAGLLEKDLGIEPAIAKEISERLRQYIFFPLRKTLEPLYNTKITFTEKKEEVTQKADEEPIKQELGSDDQYREQII